MKNFWKKLSPDLSGICSRAAMWITDITALWRFCSTMGLWREEAIFLVQQMLQDTMDAGMEADIKGYLQKTFTSGKGGGG